MEAQTVLHPSSFIMPQDEYIGVILAVCSSVAIGSSYVTTKIGLRDASKRHGFKGDGFEYFKNPIWWTGMIMLVGGELFNFAAYAFAPAVLVTPLGALSVLTGTILGAYFLKERLGALGQAGLCAVLAWVWSSLLPTLRRTGLLKRSMRSSSLR